MPYSGGRVSFVRWGFGDARVVLDIAAVVIAAIVIIAIAAAVVVVHIIVITAIVGVGVGVIMGNGGICGGDGALWDKFRSF